MYMPLHIFRSRLQQLKDSRCNILPLDQATELLYANQLPDRAVAITFDDGTADFSQRAFPLIQEFNVPVTLYLTTFYSQFQRPVFDLTCAYLLWKGKDQTLDLKQLTGDDLKLDLRVEAERETARLKVLSHARDRRLSAEEKDELAAALARSISVDYGRLLDLRMLHMISADEVRELNAKGVDIELHTHRHRVPKDRELFINEIEDNRKRIQALTGKRARHFCYPSGINDPAFLPWLEEADVRSATTCEIGFASRESHPLLLPRFLDNASLTSIEFEGWLTGISAALPRRRIPSTEIAA